MKDLGVTIKWSSEKIIIISHEEMTDYKIHNIVECIVYFTNNMINPNILNMIHVENINAYDTYKIISKLLALSSNKYYLK